MVCFLISIAIGHMPRPNWMALAQHVFFDNNMVNFTNIFRLRLNGEIGLSERQTFKKI